MGQKQESMIHKLGVHEPVFTNSQLQLSSKLWSKPKPYPTVKKFGSVHFSFFFSVSISTTWLQTVTFWMETNLKKCQKKKKTSVPRVFLPCWPSLPPLNSPKHKRQVGNLSKKLHEGSSHFPCCQKAVKKKKNQVIIRTWTRGSAVLVIGTDLPRCHFLLWHLLGDTFINSTNSTFVMDRYLCRSVKCFQIFINAHTVP